MKISLEQINTTPCDIAGNIRAIAAQWDESEAKGNEIAFSIEQSITGYPLEDKAKNPDVLRAAQQGLNFLLRKSLKMESALGVGYPEIDEDGNVYNSYAVIEKGRIIHKQRKHDLPNTDVFDEKRIYTTGPLPKVFTFRGRKIGLLICEDTWHPEVAKHLAAQGAEFFVSVNASPFHKRKPVYRINEVLSARVKETGLPIAYVNQVGGVDEIVFDGHSCALNADGTLAMQAPGFEEGLFSLDVDFTPQGARFKNGVIVPLDPEIEQIYKALVLGTRDYTHKSGFKEVTLGASGGIDSGLVAAIAVDALGAGNVHLVRMPSKYSSDHSIADAVESARLLNCDSFQIYIQNVVDALDNAISPHFNVEANPKAIETARENEHARTRGNILMGISNANHWMLLSTGNKSELGVGYCTLYGDMNGGLNPLKDAEKMLVYQLSEFRNAHCPSGMLGPEGRVVPQNTIDKKPSAELRPNQFDQDSLPPYPVLDEMLRRYVEKEQSAAQVARDMNLELALVDEIFRKVDRAEFKRRQGCPGIKVTERSFGKGRRVPIVGPSIPTMNHALETLDLDLTA